MKKNVLLVSSTPESGKHLREWTRTAHSFHLSVVPTHEGAIEYCHLHQFDVVLIDTTDITIDGKKLNAVLPILQNDAAVFNYEGETAEHITGIIQSIFTARKYRRMLNMILPEPGENGQELPSFSLN